MNTPVSFVLRSMIMMIAVFAVSGAFAQSKPQPGRGEAEALFMQIHSVLTHPRCLNCHPKGDSPKQGIVRQIHEPPITRGPRDHGPAGIACAACHQTENYSVAGVPGAPNWHLAPRSQAWEDKSPGEICRSIKDRRTNGNKTLAQIVHHMTEDKLVAWGWAPGKDNSGNEREPVPIAKAEFNRIVHAWAKAGAVCPQ